MGWASRIAREVSSSTQRIAFATGLPTAPCTTPWGDMVLRLAIQNRQDYVRLHSHEYHLMAQSVDPHLRMGERSSRKISINPPPPPTTREYHLIMQSIDPHLRMLEYTFSAPPPPHPKRVIRCVYTMQP